VQQLVSTSRPSLVNVGSWGKFKPPPTRRRVSNEAGINGKEERGILGFHNHGQESWGAYKEELFASRGTTRTGGVGGKSEIGGPKERNKEQHKGEGKREAQTRHCAKNWRKKEEGTNLALFWTTKRKDPLNHITHM